MGYSRRDPGDASGGDRLNGNRFSPGRLLRRRRMYVQGGRGQDHENPRMGRTRRLLRHLPVDVMELRPRERASPNRVRRERPPRLDEAARVAVPELLALRLSPCSPGGVLLHGAGLSARRDLRWPSRDVFPIELRSALPLALIRLLQVQEADIGQPPPRMERVQELA